MYFYPVGGGPLLDLIFVFAILGGIIYGIVLVCKDVKKASKRAFRKAERDACRLPKKAGFLVVNQFGIWDDGWFYPSHKITVEEFYASVKDYEERIQKKVDPSYRYRGPMRLEPDKHDD